jgi:glucose-6-phosphate dehydrogenase assembly protein OpcA
MPEATTLTRGMPVEISQINRQLKSLWEQDSDVLTRASLVNFAIYSEAPDALNTNTQLMAEITREHACRAILLSANPAATKRRVQAWISAHCHVSRAGARQVCSEQLSFLIEGGDPAMMTNILFSHLDSDLPLYLWWQGQFSERTDAQLWNWVDRLFYDSLVWREPAQQLQILRQSFAGCKSRCVLCDLNWRRLIYIRLALAQLFDHPWARDQIDAIRTVEVTHNPEYWTTAVLLVSWLARQLGWELKAVENDRHRFGGPAGEVEVKMTGMPGPWISEVQFRFRDGRLDLVWSGDFLQATLSNHAELTQMLPAGGTSLASLVNEELIRGGEHRTYECALSIAGALWA